MPVDRRHPLTGDHCAQQELDHFDPIAHQQRNMTSRRQSDIVTQKTRESMAAIEKIGEGPLPCSVIHRQLSGAISSEFEEHISFPASLRIATRRQYRRIVRSGRAMRVALGELIYLQNRIAIRTRETRQQALFLDRANDITFKNSTPHLR